MPKGFRATLGVSNLKIVRWGSALGFVLLLVGTAWATEGGGHGHTLDWTNFWLRLLNFSIMLAILVKLIKKPMANFFASRRENIKKLLEELEAQKEAAEEKAAEYKSRLESLEEETEKIVSEYVQEGEREKQKILEAAQEQAEYIKQQARFTIQQEIKAAKESLQEEIAELSVMSAEELLKKNIRPADQQRLVKEFTKKAVEAK